MILVDLGRLWRVAGLEGLTTCGIELHGDPTPYKKIASWKLPISERIDHSMHRAMKPLGVRRLVNDDWRLLGVRRLVNDE